VTPIERLEALANMIGDPDDPMNELRAIIAALKQEKAGWQKESDDLRALLKQREEAVRWVLNDMAHIAPELLAERRDVYAARLRAALEGKHE
jgi:uncharacterized protein YicC (UPF0701 family)